MDDADHSTPQFSGISLQNILLPTEISYIQKSQIEILGQRLFQRDAQV